LVEWRLLILACPEVSFLKRTLIVDLCCSATAQDPVAIALNIYKCRRSSEERQANLPVSNNLQATLNEIVCICWLIVVNINKSDGIFEKGGDHALWLYVPLYTGSTARMSSYQGKLTGIAMI